MDEKRIAFYAGVRVLRLREERAINFQNRARYVFTVGWKKYVTFFFFLTRSAGYSDSAHCPKMLLYNARGTCAANVRRTTAVTEFS